MSVTSSRRLTVDWATIALPLLSAPVLLFPPRWWFWALVPVAAVAIARKTLTGSVAPGTGLSAPVAMLLASVAVSAWMTPGLPQGAGKLGGVLLGALVYWGVIVFADRRTRFLLVLAGFVLCGLAVGALSLVGTAWEVKFETMRPLVALFPVRFKALPGAEDGFNANPVGATMALIVAVAALLARDLWPRPGAARLGGVALAAGTVLAGFVLFLSQSRSAWLGVPAGLAVTAVAAQRSRRQRVLSAALAAATFLCVAVVTISPEGGVRALLAGRGRPELWSRGVMVIRDFPLTGVGANVFRTIVHRVYPPFNDLPSSVVPHAHNGMLAAGVDFGLPAMTAYVALWATLLITLARVSRDEPDALIRHAAQGLLIGAVAQAVFQVTDVIPLGAKVGALWWVLLGLAAAAQRLSARFTPPPTGASVRAAGWWAAGSLVASAVVAYAPTPGVLIGAMAGALAGWTAAPRLPRADALVQVVAR